MNNTASSAPRWLGAVLCLIASFAFALRDTAAVDSGAVGSGAQAVHAAHASCDAPMRGMEHSPAPRQGTHDHAGHCPFCFTGGFALEARAIAPVGPQARRPSHAPPLRVQARATTVRHADARAPPRFIA